MKYIFTIIASFLIVFTSNSQSLSLVYKSADSISGGVFADLEGKVTVENTSANTNTYKVERIELSMQPGHSSYFCWSIDCYPPNVSLATSDVVLGQNDRDSTFIGYLTPYDNNGGISGTSVVKYIFFNVNDAADTISTVFVYNATGSTGIVDTRILKENDFYAYPNPSTNYLNIAFGNIKAHKVGKVIIRNALGSELINSSFDLNRNLATVDVSRLERGVYFYTIQLDGKNVHTKKFAVSK